MGKNNKNKEKPIKKTSKLFDNGNLLEQGYNRKEDKTYYIRWDFENERYELQKYLEFEDIKYVPIYDDLLRKNAVILPEKPIDYGTIEDLEINLDSFIECWLDISEEHRQKVVWYIMMSWIIDNLHTIPYLRALGDYGTGKTRYLDVIGGLCYKPMFVGGAVRSAPIYRVIDLWRGTAIFDEFTLGKTDETEDIIQILNNGYQRGKPVLRCKDGNYDEVLAFDPFGAKILATKKEFYDKALESRCITEVLKTTPRENMPIDLTETFFKNRRELQNKLLMFRFRNIKEMVWDESIKIDFGRVLPRVKQALAPFTILFQYDQERLKSFAKYVGEYNRKLVEDNLSSFDGQIVNAYFQLLENHNEEQQYLDDYNTPYISASDIKNYLVDDGWKADKINTRTIGRHMKSLGFDSKVTRLGKKTKKTLSVDERTEKMLRMKYDVTNVTNVTVHGDEVTNNSIYNYKEKET